MKTELSLAEARRIALAAQGFADSAPRGRVDRRVLGRVLARIALLQIDSVNVVVRSHYLPLFSRVGAYDVTMLDRESYGAKRSLFEYWAHMASLVPIELQPLLRWRMDLARRGVGVWPGIARLIEERPEVLARVRAPSPSAGRWQRATSRIRRASARGGAGAT
jgi:uncharacterized protein YcaQ